MRYKWEWLKCKLLRFFIPDKQFYIVGTELHSVLHPILKSVVKEEEDGKKDDYEERDRSEPIY